ncbi:serine-glyoxylate aminotransferase [Mycolicibacterium brisbanense]|uniref:Serine-glyoxylate aminotransferase n=1 Tax=Mycolicibacterium brisbanense TaxID=146020 RepID=A0A100W511_9MYCO|nr:serine-glyoxylate aminotransferase [Mycolicibacterium brisbanense]
MARGIDGDDEEAQTGDPAEHPEVRPPAQSQAVQKNQRYSPASNRNTDLVSVLEPNYVVGQSNPGSRSTGCRRIHRASLLFWGLNTRGPLRQTRSPARAGAIRPRGDILRVSTASPAGIAI